MSFDVLNRKAADGHCRAATTGAGGAHRSSPRRRALTSDAFAMSLQLSENRWSIMTEAEFRALAAQGYNRIPLVLESFADLDTPLSLYLKLANQRYTLPARIGRRRRALRPLLVHRPAGEDPHSRARARDRGRGSAAAIVERHEGDPLAFIGDIPAPLPRRAACPGCRASAAGSPAISATTPCATSRRSLAASRRRRRRELADIPDILLLLTEELAVVDNLSGKISLIVYADPARAGRLLGTRSERLQELRRKLRAAGRRSRYQTGGRRHRGRERVRRRGATRPRCARSREYIAAGDIMQVVHLAAHAPAVRRVAAVALPRAALAQSVAVHVLLRLRRLPRRRRVARNPGAQGRRQRSRCGRSPARGRAARRARPTRRWRPSCSPTRRRSPST